MKIPVTARIECTSLPILSSQSQGWENILVEQFQHPAGEGKTYYHDEHKTVIGNQTLVVHCIKTNN
jgi:AraC family transcriptional regulator